MTTRECCKCSTLVVGDLLEYRCRGCGKVFCGKHLFCYVGHDRDGSNGAITKNLPNYCAECTTAKYLG